jgi:hypothetical protein
MFAVEGTATWKKIRFAAKVGLSPSAKRLGLPAARRRSESPSVCFAQFPQRRKIPASGGSPC